MHDLSTDVVTVSAKAENGSTFAAAGYDENRVRTMSNADVVRRLSRIIQQKVQVYYPDRDSRSARVVGKAWGGEGSARTFRFEIRSKSLPKKNTIYVKLYPIYERFNPALLEYETLHLLYYRMPLIERTCQVSRPLDFYPELNAYAMESAGNSIFKQYLLKNNSRLRRDESLSELFSIVAGCATWLKTFHEITRSGTTKKFDYPAYMASINEDCDYRALKNQRFKRETIRALGAVFGKLRRCHDQYDLPCAKSHWDFTPAHVFVDEDRIRVIDVLGGENIPIYEDLGRFLAAMSTVNNLPFYPLFDHQRAETTLCDRFLEAYARGRGLEPEQFMLFTHIYKLKHLILWFCGQRLQVSSRIHPIAGTLFADLRLVGLFERSLMRTINEISQRMDGLD